MFQTHKRKDWSGMHFVWSNEQETNAHCFVYKVGLGKGSVRWSHGKKQECAGRLQNKQGQMCYLINGPGTVAAWTM
jgi:hypothetical protein